MARSAFRWVFLRRRGGLAIATAIGLTCSALAAALFLVTSAGNRHAAEQWQIHEWGTFTALQNDTGEAVGGINVDDELLPSFVRNLNAGLIHRSFSLEDWNFKKGLPDRYPFVTLRLETPVVYFHPPQSLKEPQKVDVDVALHGGWLTQFYPGSQGQCTRCGAWARWRAGDSTNHAQDNRQPRLAWADRASDDRGSVVLWSLDERSDLACARAR